MTPQIKQTNKKDWNEKLRGSKCLSWLVLFTSDNRYQTVGCEWLWLLLGFIIWFYFEGSTVWTLLVACILCPVLNVMQEISCYIVPHSPHSNGDTGANSKTINIDIAFHMDYLWGWIDHSNRIYSVQLHRQVLWRLLWFLDLGDPFELTIIKIIHFF